MVDYARINQAVYDGIAEKVKEGVEQALEEGLTPEETLNDCLISAMNVVGEDFKHNVVYVPEVLMSAHAMKAGLAILKPLLSSADSGVKPTGTLVMGTVKGDLHDIGKNLVCMMAEGAGFTVHDLGVDQSVEKYLAAVEEFKPDIVGMSALLTTTMPYMKTVIDRFGEEGLDHIKLAVGGAPVGEMFAEEVGADGYGGDASSAVELFLGFVGKS